MGLLLHWQGPTPLQSFAGYFSVPRRGIAVLLLVLLHFAVTATGFVFQSEMAQGHNPLYTLLYSYLASTCFVGSLVWFVHHLTYQDKTILRWYPLVILAFLAVMSVCVPLQQKDLASDQILLFYSMIYVILVMPFVAVSLAVRAWRGPPPAASPSS